MSHADPLPMYDHETYSHQVASFAREMFKMLSERLPLQPVIVLPQAFMFAADLLRAWRAETQAPLFVDVKHDDETERKVEWLFDLAKLSRCHVLLVTDVLATGQTVNALWGEMKYWAHSCAVLALADKPKRRVEQLEMFNAAAFGFPNAELFLVGNGLAFNGQHADLPGLWRVELIQA